MELAGQLVGVTVGSPFARVLELQLSRDNIKPRLRLRRRDIRPQPPHNLKRAVLSVFKLSLPAFELVKGARRHEHVHLQGTLHDRRSFRHDANHSA